MNVRRFIPILRPIPFLLLVPLIAPSVPRALATQHIPDIRRSIAGPIVVIPSQVRIGEWPVQVGTLPLGGPSPYLFAGHESRMGTVVPTPDIHDIQAATLSPDGKLIAYVASEGVVVADRSGHKLGVEENARGFRWSPDGASLALLMGKSASRPDAAAGLGIWDLKRKAKRYHRRDVYRISWGANDTLYYGLGGGYWSIQPGNRSPSRTWHHGIEVSPDGLYSLDRVRGYWSGYRIVHDRTGVDVSSPTFAALGSFTLKHTAEPFWIKGSAHLLCVSVCGLWPNADSTRWECRTGVVDVLKSKLLAWWSGMSLGPSADGKSVWITDGYAVMPWIFHGFSTGVPSMQDVIVGSAAGRHPDEIRVRASTREWTSRNLSNERNAVARSYVLRAGDSISSPYETGPPITLVEILSSGLAVFRVDTRAYSVTSPHNRQPEPGFYEVGKAGIVINTNSKDGGYITEVSVVP